MNAFLLAALALVDAAFAGFRAYTGRDGRIRKSERALLAARRGLAVGAPALLLSAALAVTQLVTAADRGARYAELDAAAHRMLLCYAPYAVIVALSLGCYLWGPFRWHPRRGRRPRAADPGAPAGGARRGGRGRVGFASRGLGGGGRGSGGARGGTGRPPPLVRGAGVSGAAHQRTTTGSRPGAWDGRRGP